MASPPALGTSAVLERMADALPARLPPDDEPDVASAHEAVALLVHAYFATLDFALVGFQEDKPLSADDRSLTPRLPPQWNARPSALGFVYSHPQSSMTFVVRIDRMGPKVEVRALALGADRICRFDRPVRDLVRDQALPLRVPRTQHGAEDRPALIEKLRTAFVSDQAVADLLRDLQIHIVQELIPELQKEGYVDVDDEVEATARSERRAQELRGPDRPFRGDPEPNASYPRPGLLPEPARGSRRPPIGDFPPPDFEDEHEINQPPRAAGIRFPDGRSPFNIGHDDLHPPGLGPHDPLRGSLTGGPLGVPRPGGSAGMHPTFDDPLFGGDGYGDGAGFDPQAPPGARWDPVGPGGGPRFGGPGGGRFGGGPGGGFGGGFGGGHII